MAVEYSAGDILYFLIELDSERVIDTAKGMILSLQMAFLKTNSNFLGNLDIFRMLLQFMSYKQAEDIMIRLNEKLARQDVEGNPLFGVHNVVLACCLVYEAAYLVGREYNFLEGLTQEVMTKAEGIGANYLLSIRNEDKLRQLVFDKDFRKRDCLYIISKYNIVRMMNNKNMEKIALELWESSYDVKSNFMECSSAYRMLFYVDHDKMKDSEVHYRFYNAPARKLENYGHHQF